MDKLCELGWSGFHFDTQALPEFDVLVEPCGEVSRGVLGSLVPGKGDLHGVEVPDGPQYVQVDRSELSDEALHILDQYSLLCGEYLQKGE